MEKKKVTLKNGEVVSYVEQGQGEKTIILIHGNFSSSLHFTPLLERLPKDMKVIAPDLRGYGDSSYYRRISSLADLANDVHLLIEVLKIKPSAIKIR
mgnify:CR=1 FL=1